MNYSADALSDFPSDFEIDIGSDVEIDSLLENSYESDIAPPKRQICKTCLPLDGRWLLYYSLLHQKQLLKCISSYLKV